MSLVWQLLVTSLPSDNDLIHVQLALANIIFKEDKMDINDIVLKKNRAAVFLRNALRRATRDGRVGGNIRT